MENVSTDSSISNDHVDHEASVTSVTLKGSVFTLPIVKLHNSDLTHIARDLQSQIEISRGFFKNSPVILDLSLVQNQNIDFSALKVLLIGQELVPVGIQGGSEKQKITAIGQGLGIIPNRTAVVRHHSDPSLKSNGDGSGAAANSVVNSTESESDVSRIQSSESLTEELIPSEETLIVSQPLRSGQRIYARGGDLIQLAAVNAGAEIMADGNIHIYAPLRGRALAGVNGNRNARIFCHSFEAELVAIAGSYKVFEDDIDSELYKNSIEICLQKEQLIIRSIS